MSRLVNFHFDDGLRTSVALNLELCAPVSIIYDLDYDI